jgi:hypothetical protein
VYNGRAENYGDLGGESIMGKALQAMATGEVDPIVWTKIRQSLDGVAG